MFCDADYNGDKSDRKSVSGYVSVFAGVPISWRSRKQQTVVSMSTMEAEFYSTCEAAIRDQRYHGGVGSVKVL